MYYRGIILRLIIIVTSLGLALPRAWAGLFSINSSEPVREIGSVHDFQERVLSFYNTLNSALVPGSSFDQHEKYKYDAQVQARAILDLASQDALRDNFLIATQEIRLPTEVALPENALKTMHRPLLMNLLEVTSNTNRHAEVTAELRHAGGIHDMLRGTEAVVQFKEDGAKVQQSLAFGQKAVDVVQHVAAGSLFSAMKIGIQMKSSGQIQETRSYVQQMREGAQGVMNFLQIGISKNELKYNEKVAALYGKEPLPLGVSAHTQHIFRQVKESISEGFHLGVQQGALQGMAVQAEVQRATASAGGLDAVTLGSPQFESALQRFAVLGLVPAAGAGVGGVIGAGKGLVEAGRNLAATYGDRAQVVHGAYQTVTQIKSVELQDSQIEEIQKNRELYRSAQLMSTSVEGFYARVAQFYEGARILAYSAVDPVDLRKQLFTEAQSLMVDVNESAQSRLNFLSALDGISNSQLLDQKFLKKIGIKNSPYFEKETFLSLLETSLNANGVSLKSLNEIRSDLKTQNRVSLEKMKTLSQNISLADVQKEAAQGAKSAKNEFKKGHFITAFRQSVVAAKTVSNSGAADVAGQLPEFVLAARGQFGVVSSAEQHLNQVFASKHAGMQAPSLGFDPAPKNVVQNIVVSGVVGAAAAATLGASSGVVVVAGGMSAVAWTVVQAKAAYEEAFLPLQDLQATAKNLSAPLSQNSIKNLSRDSSTDSLPSLRTLSSAEEIRSSQDSAVSSVSESTSSTGNDSPPLSRSSSTRLSVEALPLVSKQSVSKQNTFHKLAQRLRRITEFKKTR